MRGDVDTEWVVLTVKSDGERSMIGLRDGSRWGYGHRTREIYEMLVRAVEDLSAAQFSRTPGFEPYTELDHVFAMPIPQGWSSYHHELVAVDGVVRWGVVVFSEQPLIDPHAEIPLSPTSNRTERKRVLRELQQGKATAWILRRFESSGGMSCAEFKHKTLHTLRRQIAEDPFFGVPFTITDDQPFETVSSIDDCATLRLKLEAVTEEDRTVVLDLRMVSRGGAVALIGLRTTAEDYDHERKMFDEAVRELRFAATRD
jgi:hypothetical protein